MVEYDPFVHHEDPYPIYKCLRDEAPVYYNKNRDIWAISRYADVKAAALDWQTFSSAGGIELDPSQSTHAPGDLLDTDPPRHNELAKLVRPDFAPQRIGGLEPLVRAEVSGLIDQILERGDVDLVANLAHPVPLSLISHIMGIPRSDQPVVTDWFFRLIERQEGEEMAPAEARQAGQEYSQYVRDAIATRRRTPRDDLFTRLAGWESTGEMSAKEVLGMTTNLLVAGIHTTESLIATALLLLQPRGGEREVLAASPASIPGAIEEILRFEAPVQWLGRTTTRETELAGTKMPAGARVALLWGSANRDERVINHPDELVLSREPVRHFAFGQGIHMCIGAPLARLEGRVVLEEFLRRVPCYDVVGPVERRFTKNDRGIHSLPVRISRS
jgi:cytochrome P450